MARTQLNDLEEIVPLSEEEKESISGGDADLFTNQGTTLGGVNFEG